MIYFNDDPVCIIKNIPFTIPILYKVLILLKTFNIRKYIYRLKLFVYE